ALRGTGQRLERAPRRRAVARGAQLLEAAELVVADRVVVDGQGLDLGLALEAVLVDADDDVGAGVDARLLLGRAGLDLQLGPAAAHRLGHAAHGVDLLDDL